MLTHYHIIDKKVLKKSVYLFEYGIDFKHVQKINPILIRHLQAVGLEVLHSQSKSKMIHKMLAEFSPIIPLAPNLVLLYNLKDEKMLRNFLEKNAASFYMSSYSLFEIEKGHLYSTWLKKLN